MRSARPAVLVVMLLVAACSDDGSTAGTVAPARTDVATTTAVTMATDRTMTTDATATVPAPPANTQASATTVPALPATTPAPAQCATLAPGVTETTLTGGGETHDVRVFVPSAYAGTPLPVVIDWHGLGSNGAQQAMYSGYETVAEALGFIVVHPTGVADVAGGPTSWQLFPTPGPGRDDLAFAGALIDELIANWCADPARVYSTGMSNGGFFTARLICEMADRIAAAVSVAGTYHPQFCRPVRDVPYMAIHGTEDAVVPYLGGDSALAGPGSDDALRVFFEHVIPAEFAEFAADSGCDPITVDTSVGADVIRHEYTGCDGDTPIIFDEVRGGGHTWPSSPMASLTEGALGYTTTDIDATRDGWAFMSQFTLSGG